MLHYKKVKDELPLKMKRLSAMETKMRRDSSKIKLRGLLFGLAMVCTLNFLLPESRELLLTYEICLCLKPPLVYL